MSVESKDSFSEQYGEARIFRRIIECMDLIELMRHSCVGRNFKPSDRIPSTIRLTPAGQKFFRDLASKSNHPKEARLATFLEFFREELLVDIEATDIESLREIVSEDIQQKRIRHPFVHGPHLYDAACAMFPDIRRTLSVSETRMLLERTPVGVYQIGRWVTGPAGLLESQEERLLRPSMRVALQHCPDARCGTVHSVQLLSDPSAAINQTLRQINDLSDVAIAKDNQWGRFLRNRLEEFEDKNRRPRRWTTYVWSLGDLLTPREVRLLRSRLAGEAGGSGDPSPEDPLAAEKSTEEPSPDEFAADLQQVLLHSDDDIIREIDELIFRGNICLKPGEVREAKLDIRHNPANPGIPQLSVHGPRIDPQSPALPLLQLGNLVERTLSGKSAPDAALEVNWLLRNVDGRDADDRIVQALERVSPRDLLRTLAFSDEERFRRICLEMGLHVPDNSSIDPRLGSRDEAILDALIWSLGFDLDFSDDVTSNVRRVGAEIQSLLQDFHTTSSLDVEALRGAASNFYTFLEGALTDIVQFAWWALTTDHVKSARPFAYRPAHGEGAWKVLSQVRTKGSQQVRLRDGRPAGLQAMVNSLDVLADHLVKLQGRRESLLREDDSISVDRTGLTRMPFRHRHIFLDLLPEAQTDIIDGLRRSYSTLSASGAVEVRNGLMHFGRSDVPSHEALRAVDGVVECLQWLEEAGLARSTWRQSSATTDQWGRRAITLKSERNVLLQLIRPKLDDTRWFPAVSAPHYVVPAARFSRYEVIRFSVDVDSEHAEFWKGYPNPRVDWRLYEKPSAALQDNIRGGMNE